MKDENGRLRKWQERLAESAKEYDALEVTMDHREALYGGTRELKPLVCGDRKPDGGIKKTSHVRNIVFENIESCVSSSIPQPKVTPRRAGDEALAAKIEHWLRNELDRLPFEEMNDMAERTVPLQGAAGWMIDWDNRKRTHDTVGEIEVQLLHPKQFAPQPGVYTAIEDMDWWITKFPTTKEAVKRRYGKDVSTESESEPEVRGAEAEPKDDAVTLYVGYEHGENGGYDRYVWCNDTELEYLQDYQARRQPVCKKCGRMKPLPGEIIGAGTEDAREAEGEPVSAETQEPERYDGRECPYCGGTEFETRPQEYEEIVEPFMTAAGLEVPGLHIGKDEDGLVGMVPTRIPFYKPDLFPIVLQKSVSVYGKLLGNSDVDMIEDQQNTINRLEQKIIDRIVKAGTRITMPDRADIRVDPEDSELMYIGNAQDAALIQVHDFTGNLQYEMAYLAGVYEEARQILGITDSFQGRKDTTATSGKAKEFSAAQSAGRLESKRVMKNAAYAKLFELMFKFFLAYSDEPRPVSYQDYKGETMHEEISRYDFLRRGEDGEWWWNDQFLFSTDTSAPLESNREAMWQETRMNLQSGAFGDPTSTETLILFWGKMEMLHYPGAAETKKYLEDRLQREQEAMMQQMQMQQQAMMQQMQPSQGAAEEQVPPELLSRIEQQAQQDAARDAGMIAAP